MSERLKKFEFTQNAEAIVNDELVIPVPDGYQFYSEVEEGTGTRLLVITPKGYSRDKDPYDAEFAMSIPQFVNIGISFDADKSETYKSIFTSQFSVFKENIIIDEVGCRENFGVLHQNFYDDSDPSYNKVLAIIFVNTRAYISHIYFNHPGYDARDQELINRFLSAVDEWMLKFRLTTEESDSVKAIPISFPDEKLYPRYCKAINDPLAGLGAVVVRNSTGTDYQFISFSKMIDDGLSDEADPVFRRIKDADKSNFSPATEAEKYKTVFRVSASAFNEKHDRECEIDEGYIQKDYMLIALRSFAWTLASYCSKNNTEPAQMSFDDFKRIADYCEKHDWLNFTDFSYCKGLCDCGDLHIYYIPDSVSDSDRKFIEPSQEDYDRVEKMRSIFPNYNEILSEVKSLDKLREDLTYVYPAMAAIYDKLSAERNIKEELTGSCADILYAWCAIAKAAKEPFYIEDGPMNCWFTQKEAAESLGVSKDTSEKKSVTNTSAASKSPIGTSTHDGIEVVQLTEKSKGVRFNFGEFEGYDGEEVHIALPEGTDAVGFNAFNCNYSVKTVVIPEGTTKIDMDAFEFAKISCIVLPSTLDTISFNAFRWCENLKEVVLPDGLKEIGSDAFSGCSGLKYIYIPDSVFDFGMDCFDDLDDCIFHVEPGSDAEEYIRENYEDYKIVYSKPAGYGNLPEIKIISKTAVVSADGFVTIEPDDGDVDSDYDGELTRYNGDAKKIRISDEFDTIESDAFAQNETIENVIIPDSVSSINSDAFSFCKNLKSIVLPNDLDIISSGLFWDCTNLEEVNIPDSVTEIEFNAFSGCKKIKITELPEGICVIGESAFAGCESLESIVLPEGLETIEYEAFSACTNLKKVTIPSSVCEIDETAFDFEQCVFFVEEGSYADEFLQGLEYDVTIEYV